MKTNPIPWWMVIALTAAAGIARGDVAVGDAATARKIPAVSSSARASATWLTNLDEAKRVARAEHKSVLMDFTGSDWCGWCMKLDHEVFATPEFKEYASKHLVLVKVDFPRRKALPEEERTRNEQLAERYDVQGFPTLVVLDSNGRQVGTMGYVDGGPEAFLAELSKTLASR